MKSITVAGETIVYQELGTGAPLVFISGLGGLAEDWGPDMKYFGKTMHCLSLEHPGIGGTHVPDKYFCAPQMADRIAAGLVALGVESATIVGMSMGGAVALELALRHTNLIQRLVLTSTFAKMDARSARALTILVKLMGACDLKQALRMFDWLGFGADYYDRHMNALDASLDEYVANPIKHEVFEYQLEACLEHDVRHLLSRIACPVLVIHGTEDLLVRPKLAQELANGLPNARLFLMEGAGHSCNWEQPEVFRSQVDAFIAETS